MKQKTITIIFASIIILLGMKVSSSRAADVWSGLIFNPSIASTIGGKEVFFGGFEETMRELKNRGINTVVLYVTHGTYRFKCETDSELCKYGELTGFDDARRMAEIVRQNNMNLVVGFEIFTHQYDGPPGEPLHVTHPEYMLAGNDWQSGRQYREWEFAKYDGITYRSLQAHTASLENAPPNSAFWQQDTSNTRDPFNVAGEQLIFKMMDELILAFSAADGTKPTGFIVGGDELDHFYDDPVAQTGHTAAEIYTMVFNNAYNHIKANFPGIEMIMWGDMLNPYGGGGPRTLQNGGGRDTAGATDLLNKGIIIAEWLYFQEENNPIRFNSVTKTFPSVSELTNKGFRVWTAGWYDAEANESLIWTGNMEQVRSGKIMGHLYTTWSNYIATELPKLLNDQSYIVPDSMARTNEAKKIYRGIADSINSTASLIGIHQCRGTDYFCGTYPNCVNANSQDGLYQGIFRDYYCSSNTVNYQIIDFPNDYVSYWKFDGNANDESGHNNGTLMNGATIFSDPNRGNVLKANQTGQYVKVPDSVSLDMGTGSFTVSTWVKAGAGGLGTIVAKGPHLNSLNLLLTSDGKLVMETNGNNFWRYSMDGKNFRDNQWHHVVGIFDNTGPVINFYVDNVLVNGTKMSGNGTNDKSNAYDLYIGTNNGEGGQYQFNGLIDDIIIYNRALSPSEITRIFVGQGGAGYTRFAFSDLNQDSSINSSDLDILKSDFLKLTVNLTNPRSDINADGQCTVRDLGILMSQWGK